MNETILLLNMTWIFKIRLSQVSFVSPTAKLDRNEITRNEVDEKNVHGPVVCKLLGLVMVGDRREHEVNTGESKYDKVSIKRKWTEGWTKIRRPSPATVNQALW